MCRVVDVSHKVKTIYKLKFPASLTTFTEEILPGKLHFSAVVTATLSMILFSLVLLDVVKARFYLSIML